MSTALTEISLASKQDFSAIASIYNEYIALGTSNMEETSKTIEDIEGWVNKFNDRERLFALKEAGAVIGWGIIKRYSDREGYRFACETAVYIAQAHLGRGLGTHMKKFLIEECKRLNYRHLVAKIFASNQASIAYNEKLGYTTVGVQKGIGYKNGEWIDMVIMQYLIPESPRGNDIA